MRSNEKLEKTVHRLKAENKVLRCADTSTPMKMENQQSYDRLSSVSPTTASKYAADTFNITSVDPEKYSPFELDMI